MLLALAGLLPPLSMKIANPWERAILLRLGRCVGTRRNDGFFIIPFIDAVATWIDTRTQTMAFDEERAPSRDKAPVNVDAAAPAAGDRASSFSVRGSGTGCAASRPSRPR